MHMHTHICTQHYQLYTTGKKACVFDQVGIKMDFALANYASVWRFMSEESWKHAHVVSDV